MIRMLASILPGIVVGLGVIAYLEREHLQEKWAIFSGEATESDSSARQQEPYLRSTPMAVSRAPEPKPLPPQSQPLPREPVAPSVDPSPSPSTLTQHEQVAVVERPQRKEPPQQPSYMKPANRPSNPEPIMSFVEPLVDDVLGSNLSHSLPLADRIARSSQPMGELARQFDPIATPSIRPQPKKPGDAGDVWRLEGATEAVAQPQWLWNQGRQAFWEGDYDRAIESYRSLLQEEPKNPDAWGELGNIYYAKKDWVRAVRAFGRAAAALTQAGREEEAEKIMVVIRGIDPQLAKQLTIDLMQEF